MCREVCGLALPQDTDLPLLAAEDQPVPPPQQRQAAAAAAVRAPRPAAAAAAQPRGGGGAGEPPRRAEASPEPQGPRGWLAQAKQQQQQQQHLQQQRPASPLVEILLPGRIPASFAAHNGGGQESRGPGAGAGAGGGPEGDGEACESPTARAPGRRLSNRVGEWAARGSVRSSQSSRAELMHVLGQMEEILDDKEDDAADAAPGGGAGGWRPSNVIVEGDEAAEARSPGVAGQPPPADSALGSPSSFDASGHNVEALRQLCEHELGFDKFVAVYQCAFPPAKAPDHLPNNSTQRRRCCHRPRRS